MCETHQLKICTFICAIAHVAAFFTTDRPRFCAIFGVPACGTPLVQFKIQPSGEKNYSCWKILICRATRSVDKSRICSCNMQLQILDLSIDRVALHIKIFQHVLPLKLNLRLAVFNFVFQGDATKPSANAIAIGHSLG